MKKRLEPGRTGAGFDFTGGVRGKYAERYQAGTNVVVLDEDVASAFPTSRAVNRALRGLITRRRKSAKRPSA